MTEVDQIAVVRKDLPRAETMASAVVAKGLDGGIAERLGPPLALILGEERKGVGADLHSAQHGLVDAPRRAHVGSEIFHEFRLEGRWRVGGYRASRGQAPSSIAPI